jgi:cAMP-binding proteins - catabolite gene activator and regulatory subunit of cAMP-dependent protein kinases
MDCNNSLSLKGIIHWKSGIVKMSRKYYLCLHDILLFAGLDQDHFQLICKAANKQEIRKGNCLFKQGEPAESVYIIKEGTFKILRVTEEGEEAIIQIFGPGEIIAETGLFQQDAFHLATAMALEDSKACSIDRATFKKIIMDNPDLACGESLKALITAFTVHWSKSPN